MKFQTNTKPFADALALGIINSNVSSFHKKSHIVQISADSNTLKINIEASRICTELKLKGSGEGEPAMIFVDSLLLKQLASTLESSTITLEFGGSDDTGLTIQSGRSRFTLAKETDSSEIELTAPTSAVTASTEAELDKEDWKFVKDFQMYAVAMSFMYPVYTRVWVGDEGDVLVGNFGSGLFTHSKKSKLGNACLLQDSIINLFNSLPEGAKVAKVGRNYVIHLVTDSYEYTTEFIPEYEDDESIGSYEAPVFLKMMKHSERFSTINVPAVTKLLNQAILLSTSNEDTIKWIVDGTSLKLLDRNVDGNLSVSGDTSLSYELEFSLALLKQVIGNYLDETVQVSPAYDEDGQITGIIVWNKDLTTAFAGVE